MILGISIDKLIDWVLELAKAKEKSEKDLAIRKKEYYEFHIAPSYIDIEKIHLDYINTFGELLKIMKGSQPGHESLIDYITEKRKTLEHVRIRIKTFSEEINNSSLYKKAEKSKNQEYKILFTSLTNYLIAIAQYFQQKDSLEQMSWYSDFLDSVKGILRIYQNGRPVPTNDDFASSIHIRSISYNVEGHIRNVIEHELPNKFAIVCEQYSKLRGKFN